MFTLCPHKKFNFAKRLVCLVTLFAFLATSVCPSYAVAQTLPAPTPIGLSQPFTPPLVRGITLHPENPLKFDFIIDVGDNHLAGDAFQKESMKLIKYFLVSLTVPENDMWVNLSPYEKNRIVPEQFGQTEMGRDLLLQDYILKQLTASLLNPNETLGKEFWDKVRIEAKEKYGTTEIPTDTFNKVWIVPDRAQVYVKNNSVYVVESHLKVMLEEDYLAMSRQSTDHSPHSRGLSTVDSGLTSNLIKQIILPAIDKEVNEGKNFASLRQIQNSAILAAWYKKNLKQTILSKVYVDQRKTKDVAMDDKEAAQKIYDQYLTAFKKGVYDFIKEDYDPKTQEVVPRKYFSGGVVAAYENVLGSDNAQIAEEKLAFVRNPVRVVTGGFDSAITSTVHRPQSADRSTVNGGLRTKQDAAMTANVDSRHDDAPEIKKRVIDDRPRPPERQISPESQQILLETQKQRIQKLVYLIRSYVWNSVNRNRFTKPWLESMFFDLYGIDPDTYTLTGREKLVTIAQKYGLNSRQAVDDHAKNFKIWLKDVKHIKTRRDLDRFKINPEGEKYLEAKRSPDAAMTAVLTEDQKIDLKKAIETTPLTKALGSFQIPIVGGTVNRILQTQDTQSPLFNLAIKVVPNEDDAKKAKEYLKFVKANMGVFVAPLTVLKNVTINGIRYPLVIVQEKLTILPGHQFVENLQLNNNLSINIFQQLRELLLESVRRNIVLKDNLIPKNLGVDFKGQLYFADYMDPEPGTMESMFPLQQNTQERALYLIRKYDHVLKQIGMPGYEELQKIWNTHEGEPLSDVLFPNPNSDQAMTAQSQYEAEVHRLEKWCEARKGQVIPDTLREIAKRFRLSAPTVSKYLAQYGITTQGQKDIKLEAKKMKRFRTWAREHRGENVPKTQRQLAKRFGISQRLISYGLEEFKIKSKGSIIDVAMLSSVPAGVDDLFVGLEEMVENYTAADTLLKKSILDRISKLRKDFARGDLDRLEQQDSDLFEDLHSLWGDDVEQLPEPFRKNAIFGMHLSHAITVAIKARDFLGLEPSVKIPWDIVKEKIDIRRHKKVFIDTSMIIGYEVPTIEWARENSPEVQKYIPAAGNRLFEDLVTKIKILETLRDFQEKGIESMLRNPPPDPQEREQVTEDYYRLIWAIAEHYGLTESRQAHDLAMMVDEGPPRPGTKKYSDIQRLNLWCEERANTTIPETQREVAEMFSVSQTTVANYFEKHHIKSSGEETIETRAQRMKRLRAWAQRHRGQSVSQTQQELAVRYGFSRQTINKVTQEFKITTNKSDEAMLADIPSGVDQLFGQLENVIGEDTKNDPILKERLLDQISNLRNGFAHNDSDKLKEQMIELRSSIFDLWGDNLDKLPSELRKNAFIGSAILVSLNGAIEARDYLGREKSPKNQIPWDQVKQNVNTQEKRNYFIDASSPISYGVPTAEWMRENNPAVNEYITEVDDELLEDIGTKAKIFQALRKFNEGDIESIFAKSSLDPQSYEQKKKDLYRLLWAVAEHYGLIEPRPSLDHAMLSQMPPMMDNILGRLEKIVEGQATNNTVLKDEVLEGIKNYRRAFLIESYGQLKQTHEALEHKISVLFGLNGHNEKFYTKDMLMVHEIWNVLDQSIEARGLLTANFMPPEPLEWEAIHQFNFEKDNNRHIFSFVTDDNETISIGFPVFEEIVSSEPEIAHLANKLDPEFLEKMVWCKLVLEILKITNSDKPLPEELFALNHPKNERVYKNNLYRLLWTLAYHDGFIEPQTPVVLSNMPQAIEEAFDFMEKTVESIPGSESLVQEARSNLDQLRSSFVKDDLISLRLKYQKFKRSLKKLQSESTKPVNTELVNLLESFFDQAVRSKNFLGEEATASFTIPWKKIEIKDNKDLRLRRFSYKIPGGRSISYDLPNIEDIFRESPELMEIGEENNELIEKLYNLKRIMKTLVDTLKIQRLMSQDETVRTHFAYVYALRWAVAKHYNLLDRPALDHAMMSTKLKRHIFFTKLRQEQLVKIADRLKRPKMMKQIHQMLIKLKTFNKVKLYAVWNDYYDENSAFYHHPKVKVGGAEFVRDRRETLKRMADGLKEPQSIDEFHQMLIKIPRFKETPLQTVRDDYNFEGSAFYHHKMVKRLRSAHNDQAMMAKPFDLKPSVQKVL